MFYAPGSLLAYSQCGILIDEDFSGPDKCLNIWFKETGVDKQAGFMLKIVFDEGESREGAYEVVVEGGPVVDLRRRSREVIWRQEVNRRQDASSSALD